MERAIHLNDAEEKGKDQHQYQRCRDERLVPFQHALPAHCGDRLLLFFHSFSHQPVLDFMHTARALNKEKRDNKLSLFSRFQIGDDQISLLTLAALPVRPRR